MSDLKDTAVRFQQMIVAGEIMKRTTPSWTCPASTTTPTSPRGFARTTSLPWRQFQPNGNILTTRTVEDV